MPAPQVGHSGFQCIVTIEGAKMLVPAKMEHQRIVCEQTMVCLSIISTFILHVFFRSFRLSEKCVFNHKTKLIMYLLLLK